MRDSRDGSSAHRMRRRLVRSVAGCSKTHINRPRIIAETQIRYRVRSRENAPVPAIARTGDRDRRRNPTPPPQDIPASPAPQTVRHSVPVAVCHRVSARGVAWDGLSRERERERESSNAATSVRVELFSERLSIVATWLRLDTGPRYECMKNETRQSTLKLGSASRPKGARFSLLRDAHVSRGPKAQSTKRDANPCFPLSRRARAPREGLFSRRREKWIA